MFYHVISLAVYLSCEGALNEESFWHSEDEGMLLSRAVGSYVDARTHAHILLTPRMQKQLPS